MSGLIRHIFIAETAEAPMQSQDFALLTAGKGIKNDRYFNGQGTFSERLKDNPAAELSLIEQEAIDQFNMDHQQNMKAEDFRRNIVTESIRLNDLVGKIFTIGNIRLKGIRLCEPCPHLTKTVNALFLPHMKGRAGLRAQILTSGKVTLGETIKST